MPSSTLSEESVSAYGLLLRSVCDKSSATYRQMEQANVRSGSSLAYSCMRYRCYGMTF